MAFRKSSSQQAHGNRRSAVWTLALVLSGAFPAAVFPSHSAFACTAFPAIGLEQAADVSGTVLDEQGKPVGGAHVLILENSGSESFTTGTDGMFHVVLSGRDGVVIAWSGKKFTRIARPLAGPLILSLHPVTRTARGVAQARVLFANLLIERGGEAQTRTSLASDLVLYDSAAATRMITDADGPVNQWGLRELALDLCANDPRQVPGWSRGVMGLLTEKAPRFYVDCYCGLSCARIGDVNMAQNMYQAAKSLFASWPQDQSSGPRAYAPNILAQLAFLVGKPAEADRLVAEMMRGESGDERYMRDAASDFARIGDVPLALQIAQHVSSDHRGEVQRRIVEELSRISPTAARDQLDAIRNLRTDETRKSEAYGLGGIAVATALAKSRNPGAAKEVAESIADPLFRSRALTSIAANTPDRKAALTLLHEAFDCVRPPLPWIDQRVQVAALTYDLDPTTGEAMLDADRLADPSAYAREELGPLTPEGAFYLARQHPATAIVLLESDAFSVRRTNASGNSGSQKTSDSDSDTAMAAIILAMATVDLDRANEMIADQGEVWQKRFRFDVERRIGQYLLMPEPDRKRLSFSRWTALDDRNATLPAELLY